MKKVLLFIAVICLFITCKRDEDCNPAVQPIAQTTLPKGITCEKAILTGKGLNGGGHILERGFIYMDNSAGQITENTTDIETNAILAGQGTKITISSEGDFEYLLTGLKKETVYCAQAYMITEMGKSFGYPVLFTTSKEVPPTVSIEPEYEKEEGSTNVTIIASLDALGGDDISEKGIVWSNTNSSPTLEDGEAIPSDLSLGSFTTKMNDLQMFRKYFIRAYAQNKYGVSYSSTLMVLFMGDKFTDPRDNEVYTVKQYGNSVWLTQNFRHIPEGGINQEVWVQQYIGNSVEEAKASEYYRTYGCLYSFGMAEKLAPEGWHLASDAEWQELEILTGMSPELADKEDDWRGDTNAKLKADTWEGNGSWSNLMAFNLHPGGKQWCGGAFQNCDEHGYFWTSTINDHRADGQLNPYYRFFSPGPATGRFSDFPTCVGMSVRYVMD